jgi:hypothetical protein
MVAGTKTEPRAGHTVAEIQRQQLLKRFNSGRVPVSGEIAAGGDKDLDIDGFVQKANVKQIRVFAEGNAPTDFDIEFFSKATSDASPASDQYRQYQWQHVNTQEIDAADEPIILEDQEPAKAGNAVAKKQLHVRITNNAADTMHVTDIEILFEELIAV